MMKETFYTIPAPVSLRLALISDLHNRSYGVIVRSLRHRKPDMIMITGDLLVGYRPEGDQLIMESQEHVLPFLRACVRIAPTYVSLGNHEWIVCQEDLDLLRSTGAALLDDGWIRKGGLVIGGLTSGFVTDYRKLRAKSGDGRYPVKQKAGRMSQLPPDADWLDEFEQQKGYKILLCHHPEYWSLREPFLARRRINLVFSGHAHGGQIRLFDRGLFAPGQGFLPGYTAGLHKGRYGRLIISRGLANTSWPIPRLGNPPEIVYIRLKKHK